MTPQEFEDGLDRWGPDLDRWPPEPARQARQCLATRREARRAMDAARRLEGMLAGLREHAAPAHLAARIAARVADTAAADPSAATDPVERLIGWFTGHLWRPALFALLLTGAGFLAGAAVSGPAVDTELADDVMSLAFTDIYAELEDAQP